jgi:EpsI family protein
MAIAAVLTLGISFAPHAAISFLESGPELPQPMLSAQSLAQGGWEIADGSLADWQPSFANPAGSLNAVLAKDGRRIGIFIAYYRQQSYARKLISSGNALVKSNDKAWSEVGRDVRQAKLAGQPVMLRTGVLRSNLTNLGIEPERIKVWYWYWIDGKLITSDHLGKFWLALSRLSGHGDESAAVFVYAQEPDGDTVLADFLTSAGGGIASLLEQAAAQRR